MKLSALPLVLFVLFGNSPVFAEELKPANLPAPQANGGKPLMQALADRKSAREFSPEELSLQTLSDLLWAANGINRPESGYRTAPSAGLATVVLGWVEKEALAKAMKLRPEQHIILTQPVGFPKK
ncbi:MAG: hypothetical protein WC530_09620 [Candidatus Omnitrophota bacterium]